MVLPSTSVLLVLARLVLLNLLMMVLPKPKLQTMQLVLTSSLIPL